MIPFIHPLFHLLCSFNSDVGVCWCTHTSLFPSHQGIFIIFNWPKYTCVGTVLWENPHSHGENMQTAHRKALNPIRIRTRDFPVCSPSLYHLINLEWFYSFSTLQWQRQVQICISIWMPFRWGISSAVCLSFSRYLTFNNWPRRHRALSVLHAAFVKFSFSFSFSFFFFSFFGIGSLTGVWNTGCQSPHPSACARKFVVLLCCL